MKPSLGLVTHVWNEEMLMPHWINHHLPQCEDAIIIDHNSSDRTVEICRELAPHWRVVQTKLAEFDAHLLDQEVQEIELLLNTDFKMTLNVTEFLFCKDLPAIMEEHKDKEAIGFRAYMMVDKDLDLPLDEPLWKNRTHGYLDNWSAMNSRRERYMHSHDHGHYNLGRHGCTFSNIIDSSSWNILFASFSPWPQAVNRRLMIQTKQSQRDILQGSGIQHRQSPETLNNFYQSELAKSKDLLLTDSNFKAHHDFFYPDKMS